MVFPADHRLRAALVRDIDFLNNDVDSADCMGMVL